MPLVTPTAAEDVAQRTAAHHSAIDYFSHHWTVPQTLATQRLVWYRAVLLTTDCGYPPERIARCENLLWRIQFLLMHAPCAATDAADAALSVLWPRKEVSAKWRNRFEKWNAPLVGPLTLAPRLGEIPALASPPCSRPANCSLPSPTSALKPALKRHSSTPAATAPYLAATLEATCLHLFALSHLDLAGSVSRRAIIGGDADPWGNCIAPPPQPAAYTFSPAADAIAIPRRTRFNRRVEQCEIIGTSPNLASLSASSDTPSSTPAKQQRAKFKRLGLRSAPATRINFGPDVTATTTSQSEDSCAPPPAYSSANELVEFSGYTATHLPFTPGATLGHGSHLAASTASPDLVDELGRSWMRVAAEESHSFTFWHDDHSRSSANDLLLADLVRHTSDSDDDISSSRSHPTPHDSPRHLAIPLKHHGLGMTASPPTLPPPATAAAQGQDTAPGIGGGVMAVGRFVWSAVGEVAELVHWAASVRMAGTYL